MRGGVGGNTMNRSGPPALMNENRRDVGNSGVNNFANNRQNWNDRDRDDEITMKNRFDQNDESKDNKRSTSRWGNSSPKSVVSDEENWDDDDNELRGSSGGDVDRNGGLDNDGASASNLKEVKDVNKSNPPEPALLLETEPIDDDSQEDDFNDFDETVAAADESINDNNDNDSNDNHNYEESISVSKQDTEAIDKQNDDKIIFSPKSNKIIEPFDMFSNESDTFSNNRNPSPIPQRERKLSNDFQPQQQQQSNEIKSNKILENDSEEINQNTTPLYDEPENNDEFISKQSEGIKNLSTSVSDLEQPAIPGIDPIENDNDE